MKKYIIITSIVLILWIIWLIGYNLLNSKPDTSYIKTKYLDLAYATKSESQKLDIYIPNNWKWPFPVIIGIHWWAFKFWDKADNQLKPFLKWHDRWYAIVSVNYRLSWEAQWPAQINDVKAAVKFIRANATKYNLNPDKFATWWGSAGGNLASLIGTSWDIEELSDSALWNNNISDKVQAVVDWYGPIDFLAMDEQWNKVWIDWEKHSTDSSFESQLMWWNITTKEELVATSNPENYISKDTPPFFIQHWDKDATIPSLQSKNFSEKLINTIWKDKVYFEYIKWAAHADTMFETDENIKKVLDFLDKYLK